MPDDTRPQDPPGRPASLRRPAPRPPSLPATVLQARCRPGERILRFHAPFSLDDYGLMPVPPYILKRRKAGAGPEPDAADTLDRARYQTVYAARDGSVAAPTAGLHFTPELLARLPHAFVTLHVGLATFRPIKSETLEDHEMHEERYEIPESTAAAATAATRRVAVGTTIVRVLESLRRLQARPGRTRIFIRPPHHFRHVDALMTNFHLPRSSLLVLVAAFLGDRGPGREPAPPQDAVETPPRHLRRRHPRALPLLQLRRRDADRVTRTPPPRTSVSLPPDLDRPEAKRRRSLTLGRRTP